MRSVATPGGLECEKEIMRTAPLDDSNFWETDADRQGSDDGNTSSLLEHASKELLI